MTVRTIHATAIRLTRLDDAGQPIGDPIALPFADGATIEITHQPAEPAAVLEAWRPIAMSWSYTITGVDRRLFYLLRGWRTPSPLLARHRRRRHK